MEKQSITNDNGVMVEQAPGMHAVAINAKCGCGCELIVAPPIMCPKHERVNPIMVCADHFIHAYWFKNLVVGNHPEIKRTLDFE